MNILLDFRNDKARLGTVNHRKNRIAALQQWRVTAWIDGFMAGKETAADHKNNPVAVWLGGLDHVKRQRRSKFARVNNVLGAFVIGGLDQRPGEGNQQEEGRNTSH